MKRLLTLLLIIAWTFSANGQIIPNQIFPGQGYDSLTADSLNRCLGCLIKIEGTDALGNKDTIIIGATRNATLGVDNSLGERNYLGIQFNPLDMRLIQRDTICWGRLSTGTPRTADRSQNFIYFPNPLDLKKDIRSSLWVDIPQGGDRVLGSITKFTLKISTSNYPITLKLIQLTGFNYPINYSGIGITPINNCVAPPITVGSFGLTNVGTTVTLTSQADWYALGAGFSVNNNKNNIIKSNVSIKTNPSSDFVELLNIEGDVLCKIVNSKGETIKSVFVSSSNSVIDIKDLIPGTYILNLRSGIIKQQLKLIVK
jgi:hypothetical protein